MIITLQIDNKNLINELYEWVDKTGSKVLNAQDRNDNFRLSNEQEAQLDKTIQELEQGRLKTYTLDEVKAHINKVITKYE